MRLESLKEGCIVTAKPVWQKYRFGRAKCCVTCIYRFLIACKNNRVYSWHTLNPALLILSSISGTLDGGDWLSWRALEFNSSRGTLISTTFEPAGFSRWLADFTSFTTKRLPEFLLFSFFVGDNLIVAFTSGNCILKYDRPGFATRLNGDHFYTFSANRPFVFFPKLKTTEENYVAPSQAWN